MVKTPMKRGELPNATVAAKLISGEKVEVEGKEYSKPMSTAADAKILKTSAYQVK